MFFKAPVMEITTDEAKKLAHATKNVLAFHNLNISPAAMAYVQLLGVCVAIYGPRFAMYTAWLKMEKAKKEQDAKLQTATPNAVNQNMGQPMPQGTSTIQ